MLKAAGAADRSRIRAAAEAGAPLPSGPRAACGLTAWRLSSSGVAALGFGPWALAFGLAPGLDGGFRGRLFVDHLPHPLEVLVHLDFRPGDALLAEVNGIGQEGAAFLNGRRVAAILHLDSLGFQELTKVLVEFCFLNSFHIWSYCWLPASPGRSRRAITQPGRVCNFGLSRRTRIRRRCRTAPRCSPAALRPGCCGRC